MVQITFNSSINYPTITLSAGDYHEDIDPNSSSWVDWADKLAGKRSVLNQAELVARIQGVNVALEDDFSLTEFAQQVDNALEEELQNLQELYAQNKTNAGIIITNPTDLEKRLEELRIAYEISVKNMIALANAVLQGAYAAGAIDHIGAEHYQPTEHCFLADTSIRMWPLDPSITPCVDGSYDERLVLSKVWHKPISEIAVGDIVVAFDKQGRLQPDRVTRTMQNHATHILNFWGTGVTPGHACYCADGPFKGEHVPIMDILRTDAAMMRTDGTMFRASTNCTVGTMGDMMIHAAATVQMSDGSWTQPKPGKVRFGTRVILPDGRDVSLMELAHEKGWKVTDAGYMVGRMKGDDGTVAERAFHFPYLYGKELPKPEDYILQLSAVTLEEIYQAGEWEQIGTRMPAPFSMADFNSSNNSTMLQASKPRPNIPPAFTDHPDTPVAQTQAPPPAQAAAEPSMNLKQHKAAKMR